MQALSHDLRCRPEWRRFQSIRVPTWNPQKFLTDISCGNETSGCEIRELGLVEIVTCLEVRGILLEHSDYMLCVCPTCNHFTLELLRGYRLDKWRFSNDISLRCWRGCDANEIARRCRKALKQRWHPELDQCGFHLPKAFSLADVETIECLLRVYNAYSEKHFGRVRATSPIVWLGEWLAGLQVTLVDGSVEHLELVADVVQRTSYSES